MRETNIYHLVIEHPLISFLVGAVVIVAFAVIAVIIILNHWEKKQNEKNQENLKD